MRCNLTKNYLFLIAVKQQEISNVEESFTAEYLKTLIELLFTCTDCAFCNVHVEPTDTITLAILLLWVGNSIAELFSGNMAEAKY
jgi:hypothetical protein